MDVVGAAVVDGVFVCGVPELELGAEHGRADQRGLRRRWPDGHHGVSAVEWGVVVAAVVDGVCTYRSWSWGSSGDQPAVGDYDGDGVTDIAVYRPSTGVWWILSSASNFTAARAVQWGGGGAYTLVPGDYDGDGKTDLGLWSSAGTWYVLRSSSDFTTWATYAWGDGADIPVPKQ